MAAIRFVSGQLSASGVGADGAAASGAAAAAAAASDADDNDIAQLGTSFRDPRRIVSTKQSIIFVLTAALASSSSGFAGHRPVRYVNATAALGRFYQETKWTIPLSFFENYAVLFE